MVGRDRDLDAFRRLHSKRVVRADFADGFGHSGVVRVLQMHGCSVDESYRVADVCERLLEVGLGPNGLDLFVRGPECGQGGGNAAHFHLESHGYVLPRCGLIYATSVEPATSAIDQLTPGRESPGLPSSGGSGRSSELDAGPCTGLGEAPSSVCPMFEVCATHGCQRQCVPPDASIPRLDPTGISDSPSHSGSL